MNNFCQFKLKKIFLIIIIFIHVQTYIDVKLESSVSSADIIYNFLMTLDSQNYKVGISLQNKPQYLVQPDVVKHKHKSNDKKSHKKQHQAHMHVSSLQGYNIQGWKRFFLQVFALIDSKYQHNIKFSTQSISMTDKYNPLSNGLMTLGPKINQNKFFGLIKNQTKDNFREDIFSLFTTPGGKEIRMQLGGYQQQNARGYKNGIRFYEKDIGVSTDGNNWLLPINKLVIAKQKGKKWDIYTIPSSKMNPIMSIQSQFIILPLKLKEDLQTSLQTQNIQCSFSQSNHQLQCANISSIDEALTFISLYMDETVSLNISLYDLRDQYNTQTKVTSFFIKLSDKQNDLMIGSSLLRGYYISINMAKRSMMFSPINRFTPQISTVSILRFLIIFMLFMFAACICIVIWQQFNNPDYRRKLTRSKDGVRLVPYQKTQQNDDDQF